MRLKFVNRTSGSLDGDIKRLTVGVQIVMERLSRYDNLIILLLSTASLPQPISAEIDYSRPIRGVVTTTLPVFGS
jgi:hypothetical protein